MAKSKNKKIKIRTENLFIFAATPSLSGRWGGGGGGVGVGVVAAAHSPTFLKAKFLNFFDRCMGKGSLTSFSSNFWTREIIDYFPRPKLRRKRL